METRKQLARVLKNPSTHKLVYEVLELAHSRDIVDAINDLELVLAVLRAEFDEYSHAH